MSAIMPFMDETSVGESRHQALGKAGKRQLPCHIAHRAAERITAREQETVDRLFPERSASGNEIGLDESGDRFVCRFFVDMAGCLVRQSGSGEQSTTNIAKVCQCPRIGDVAQTCGQISGLGNIGACPSSLFERQSHETRADVLIGGHQIGRARQMMKAGFSSHRAAFSRHKRICAVADARRLPFADCCCLCRWGAP